MSINQYQSNLPHDSAGRLMVTEVPIANPNQTIGEVEKNILAKAAEFDTVDYIYALDASGKLVGAASVKEIWRAPKQTPLKEVMTETVVSARPHTDQEHVALLALKHSIKAVPVVDKEGRFLGIVPPDTIFRILHEEGIEDVLRQAGVHKFKDPAKTIITAGTFVHFRKRLPWLIVGVVGGIVAAFVVEFFEGILKQELIIAAFIPAVVYIADAVGAQTQTIFIRSMAIDHNLNLKKYLWREVKVTLLLALVLGLILSVFTHLWLQVPAIGLILGFSIFATILTAMAVAVTIPLALTKLKCDPAIASGPFATVVRDILSLLVYFAIAYVIIF